MLACVHPEATALALSTIAPFVALRSPTHGEAPRMIEGFEPDTVLGVFIGPIPKGVSKQPVVPPRPLCWPVPHGAFKLGCHGLPDSYRYRPPTVQPPMAASTNRFRLPSKARPRPNGS